MSKYFANIEQLPPDPLFHLKARYTEDKRKDKVDLGIGAYRDNNGKPWILPAVRKAEQILINSSSYNHEYLSISGYPGFLEESAKIILGDDSPAIKESRVITQQCLSGTGSLHVAGKILYNFFTTDDGKKPTVYLSNPTWANHKQIFSMIGFEVKIYPYWDESTKSLDLDGFLKTITQAPENSIFILHACAHNPTGLDPTKAQWRLLIDELAKRKHLILFDSAYQGFASGSLEDDSYAVRLAIQDPKIVTPIFVCQSFAKNCGMYGERVGALHIIPKEGDASLKAALRSQLDRLTRSEISNPPAYGAKIVATILKDPTLKAQWKKDLTTMSSRIYQMRKTLRDMLTNELKTPGNWDHIVSQTGMFSYTGLSADMVGRLEKVHAIYLMKSGRASIAGLNDHNIAKVAKAIDEVTRFYSSSKL